MCFSQKACPGRAAWGKHPFCNNLYEDMPQSLRVAKMCMGTSSAAHAGRSLSDSSMSL